MKPLACLILIALSLSSAFAAPKPMEDKKPVEVEPGFLGSKFRQDGELLKPGSMYDILGKYPETRGDVSAAKAWMVPGLVFGAAGGFLVGFTAVQPAFGKDFNAPLFLAGLGSIAVSLGCGKLADGKLRRAVETYNGLAGKGAFEWAPSPDGAVLRWSFRF